VSLIFEAHYCSPSLILPKKEGLLVLQPSTGMKIQTFSVGVQDEKQNTPATRMFRLALEKH
jgi:hypothetical protein